MIGFVATTPGMHIRGGTLMFAGVTEQQCKDLCLAQSQCLAVDYNSGDRSCWFHGNNTYCGTLIAKAGCTHFKRVNCINVAGKIFK